VISMLEPALAAVVAYAWLGEELTATQIVGCLLVLAAVAIAQTARATDYARS
jgi:drug/metabolite transporter (DMT)-like permease